MNDSGTSDSYHLQDALEWLELCLLVLDATGQEKLMHARLAIRQ